MYSEEFWGLEIASLNFLFHCQQSIIQLELTESARDVFVIAMSI